MKRFKLLVMDVDGTLTDGKIYMGNDGEEFKAFDVKDGYGITHMLPSHITPVIITGRESKIVEKRCRELGIIECHQGCSNKMERFKEVAGRYDCFPNRKGIYNEIAYIGDDENDIECMALCGIAACPGDAVRNVKKISNWISDKNGGSGAVRDFIEWICEAEE